MLGVAEHCTAVPRDLMWVTGMVLLAQLAYQLHDPVRAEELWHLLLPYSGRMGWGAVACAGPIDLRLGMLAVTLGRPDEAAVLFGSAVDMSERLRTPTWLARSLLEQARLARGDERSALAARALALASETGAAGIERTITAFLAQ